MLAGSPCSLQPRPCASGAAFCRLYRSPVGRCGSARFGARGVSRLCLCCGQGWAVLGFPCPAPWGTEVSAAQQQVLTGSSAVCCFSWCPELSLSHVFGSSWQRLGRSVADRGVLHVPVSEPSSSDPQPSPFAACSCLAVGLCPELPFGMIPGSQPGLAAPGADRRCWPCSGETLSPHRYRGIILTRACASPPSISGFSMVRHQLRVPRGCFGGSSFVLDPLRACVPGRD